MGQRRLCGTLAALIAGVLTTTATAQTLLPPMMPITQLDRASLNYVTSSGSVISRLGQPDADQLIGKAVPCRAGPNATYTLASTGAYPIPTGTRYSAAASNLAEPLSILSQGTISGQIGVGPVSVSASNDLLTRLDINEGVRLSVDTSDSEGPLSAQAVRFLDRLSGTRPAGYEHWCIITGASVWNVRYETYRRAGLNPILGQGLWIVTANGRFQRNASATVPYQVITLAITPYPASWIRTQATSDARIAAPAPARVAALAGTLSVEALERGEALAAVAQAGLVLDRLIADPGFAAQVEAASQGGE